MRSPQRGEVWLVDVGMAAKVRLALAISVPADDIDRALVTVVPHTTSPRNSRFEVVVSVQFLRAGVFDAQNLVTIPHAKLVRVLGRLSVLVCARSPQRPCSPPQAWRRSGEAWCVCPLWARFARSVRPPIWRRCRLRRGDMFPIAHHPG